MLTGTLGERASRPLAKERFVFNMSGRDARSPRIASLSQDSPRSPKIAAHGNHQHYLLWLFWMVDPPNSNLNSHSVTCKVGGSAKRL